MLLLQVCPPQSKVELGLGAMIGTSYRVSKAMDTKTENNNKLNINIYKDDNKDDNSMASIFESDFLDSMDPELVILYACLLFISLAIFL